jgi:hypothetical protein
MAHTFLPYLCLGLMGAVAIFSVILLWYIVTHPARWAELVDKENDFWVGKGMVPRATAEWFRRFEKGPAQKILVALVGLLAAIGFICLIIFLSHHGHR